MIEYCGNCQLGERSKYQCEVSCPYYTQGKDKYTHCAAWMHSGKREFKRRVFICSPFSDNQEENAWRAKKYAYKALEAGALPFVPHLLYPQFLDDKNEAERQLGITCGLAFMEACDEVWVFGETETPGMRAEISQAQRLRKVIIYISDKECESNCERLF